MRKTVLLVIFSAYLTACTAVQLVSPYDEVIYNGVTEYKDLLNRHVKDMADLGGTVKGTYEANKLKYNELETLIESLIDRATMQSTGGGCSLSPALSEKIQSYLRDKTPGELANAPTSENANPYGCTERLLVLVKVQLTTLEQIHRDFDKCAIVDDSILIVETSESVDEAAQDGEPDIGSLIDSAVDDIIGTLKETIRMAVTEKIEAAYTLNPGTVPGGPEAAVNEISCLRVATARDALNISNQSIDAAWFVENAKKNSGE